MEQMKQLRQFAEGVIAKMPDADGRAHALAHTNGVASCCALLAARSGIKPELAYVCGLLHDIYADSKGSYDGHCEGGANLAADALKDFDGFTEEEKAIVSAAILYHDDRGEVHGEYDEILKDADILQPYLNGACSRASAAVQPRLEKMLAELGLSARPGF
jgi:HD superfamily phosphodiesterase